jgi:hypothetical protein
MLGLSRLPVQASYATDMLPAMLVLAVGFGLAFPCLQTAALHGVSEDDAGLGAGVQSAVQALANALGVAVFLTVALHRAADGSNTAEAMTSGYRLAFGVGVGSLVVGALLVLLVMDRRIAPPAGMPAPDVALDSGDRAVDLSVSR